jgi:Domain of unknown function (DUF4845)
MSAPPSTSLAAPRRNAFRAPVMGAAHRQRGLGFFGLLLFGALLAVLAILAMKVVPTYIEYLAIKRAVQRVAVSSNSVLEVQASFERMAAVDDIVSIGARDLTIVRKGDHFEVSFEYEKRIPLFGPASLLLEYEGGVQ